MAHYSFIVIAPQPIGILKPFVALDSGINTFNAVIDDIDDFLECLNKEGVVVTQMCRLDEFEKVGVEDMLLPGESPKELVSKIE